jgi:hypothetical protein
MTAPAKPGPWTRFVRGLASYQGLLLLLIFIGLYLLAFLWAARLVRDRTAGASSAVVAAAELPPGHLLRPADVRLSGLAGYTKRKIEKDKPIVAADLTPAPHLTVPAGAMLAVLPINPALLDVGRAGRIDVGSPVQICGKDKKALQATVQAVICTGSACSVALPVRTDLTGALNQATVRPLSSQPCA